MNDNATAGVGGRPRLVVALVLRELDAGLIAGLLLAAAGAVAAAYYVYGPNAVEMTGVIGRMLRRFDLAVGGLMIPFIILRTAARIEADHNNGWLAPFVAAGGRRWSYGVALIGASLIAPSLILAVAAVSLAAAVSALAGSSELVALLPRTTAGGILALATVAVCVVAFGVVLRRAGPTVLITGLVILLPFVLAVRYAMSEAGPPLWAVLTLFISPLFVAPADTASLIRAVLYIPIVGVLAGIASQRFASRTP